MNREEMIELLILDKLWEWVYSHCTDTLEDLLRIGWKGYEEYTEVELKDAIEDIDVEEVKKFKAQLYAEGGDEHGLEED